MGTAGHLTRRAFVASSAVLLFAGCSGVPFLAKKDPSTSDPQAPIQAYFALVSNQQYDRARDLLSAPYQARLGSSGVQALLHSFKSADVTSIADAVQWANALGAQLSAPPADKREFLVTLAVDPSFASPSTWTPGQNRRFVDVRSRDGSWEIDNIAKIPGELITGRPAASTNTDSRVAVLPNQALRLGPAPVDRMIYTARQHAADLGEIPWAVNPIDVVHRDGPSFGLGTSDLATLVDQTTDPVTLVPKADVVVRHDDQTLVVTVEQPIRTGPGGVWAIAAVQFASSPLTS